MKSPAETRERRDLLNAKRVLNLLVKEGLLSEDQARLVESDVRTGGGSVITALVRRGFLTEEQLAMFLSEKYKVPYLDVSRLHIPEEVLRLIPPDIAQRYKVLPIRREGRVLKVAVSDPGNLGVFDDLKFITGFEIEPVVSTESAIARAIENYYGLNDILNELLSTVAEDQFEVVEEEEEEVDVSELYTAIENAPVVRLVNGIIADAVAKRASDIHIEPYERTLRVRFRIDGVMYEVLNPPYSMKNAIISRIKVMAKMNIAERRLPQDGHIKMRLPNKTIDLRVSTLPTVYGEKAVLRILDRASLNLDLSRLGFEQKALADFLEAIEKPFGMILVTGPTGSGKTTTLYSALLRLNTPDRNIITAEDPVEYDFPGINQVQIREEIGLTFAEALRSFLRQDPDVIMVGEIRDPETAGMAIRAALTGHLVLSTLHTNDAPTAPVRLIDMGVEPYLVSSSLLLVVSQRLVRKVCDSCKVPYHPSEEVVMKLGLSPEELKKIRFFKGEGCNECNNTGYKGREGIYEVMPITPAIKHLIARGATAYEIRQQAIEEGMITLREAAILKLKRGITTPEEVLRVTLEE